MGILFANSTVSAAPDQPPVAPKPKEKEVDEIPDMVDVAKTTERIIQDATAVGKRLSDKDPGAETQRIQNDIVKNIEALIRKSQEPMNGDSSSSPKGGGGMSPSNTGGSSDMNPSTGRKERREKNKSMAQGQGQRDFQPLPQPNRIDSNGGPSKANDPINKIESKNLPPRLPDAYKDVWGHLPEKMRREMDLYFREQFMPRYSELLKQYYSSLSERSTPPR